MKNERFLSCTLLLITLSACATGTHTTEFCLAGEFDLAARLQGLTPEPGEFSPARWCVTTEASAQRVNFWYSGKSNPDMEDSFAVSYFTPDRVRIVNRDSPPDIEFVGASIGDEALRYRRLDPRRLVAEIRNNANWVVEAGEDGWQTVRYPGSTASAEVLIVDNRLTMLRTEADMPLRGRVPVAWDWDWREDNAADVTLSVDGIVFFNAVAQWRKLSETEAAALWARSGDQEPREVPGDRWPARIAMELETLADGVHLVNGVRTGFSHLVVETESGLVIGDAPAGWIEIPQVPPADLVPGLGISGLSELFIDFLNDKFPGSPIRAVALTHLHDDHAGGARAFAAAAAEVYAPAGDAAFLQVALNRASMPPDRFTEKKARLDVLPVRGRVVLDGAEHTVEFLELGASPHVNHALGVWVPHAGYFFQSDIHVPRSEADAPRPGRARTECWFAAWAVEHLPDDAIILSSHTTIRTPVSRLRRYLISNLCI